MTLYQPLVVSNHEGSLKIFINNFSENPWYGTTLLTIVLILLGIFFIRSYYELILLPFYSVVSIYGSFNIFVFIFSWKNERYRPKKLSYIPEDPVTLMYLTYNDFKEEAFRTLLKAKRNCDFILIVDDSNLPELKNRIDAIAEETGSKVIRRENRKGFKAGAINNALESVSTKYISIVDSDERVPENFITGVLPYFSDDDVAFVQVSHFATNNSTLWEKYMGYGVNMHWRIYHPYRNRFGVVNYLGHGAILKKSAVESVGKFPEIVAEDIGITTEFYSTNMRGVFVDEIKAGEEFPETYSSFRRRHRKWTMGSTQFMRYYFISILKSNMRWYQKLDIIVPGISLPMTLLLFTYIIIVSFFHIGSSIMLFIVALISMGAPNLGFARMQDKKEIPKTIAINALAYVSLFPTSVYYAIKGFVKPIFLVTGEKVKNNSSRIIELRESGKSIREISQLVGIKRSTVHGILKSVSENPTPQI